MIHGLDTGFLVAAELVEHAEHSAARTTFAGIVAAGDRIAIAPQVLAEFMHVATDPRRLAQPLGMDEARRITEQWWTASEVDRVFPNDAATQQFLACCNNSLWVASACSIRSWPQPITWPESNPS